MPDSTNKPLVEKEFWKFYFQSDLTRVRSEKREWIKLLHHQLTESKLQLAKQIAIIASGTFGLSITLLMSFENIDRGSLNWSWLFLGLSITGSIWSMFFNVLGVNAEADQTRKELDEEETDAFARFYRAVTREDIPELTEALQAESKVTRNKWKKYQALYVHTAAVFLIAGIVLFVTSIRSRDAAKNIVPKANTTQSIPLHR